MCRGPPSAGRGEGGARGWPLLLLFNAANRALGAFDFQPQLWRSSETQSGTFDVWRFPLQYNEHVFYMRRFGVDVPPECAEGQPEAPCPLLVDFHGSYDSLYSQRAWTKWHFFLKKARSKFVLLTPEGSPDALYKPDEVLNDCNDTSYDCVGTSGTSWNVLGWGKLWYPMEPNATCKGFSSQQEDTYTNCFWSTLRPNLAFQCFGTHLVDDPDVCQKTSWGWADQIPTVCMSATGANDAEYIAKVLRFVVDRYKVDASRLYFSGQSMGGMAALQFADAHGKQALSKELRPAALVACSAGASRSSWAQLDGEVKTMLMWGYADHIAPPTVWSGYDRNLTALVNTSEFAGFLRNASLLRAALEVTGGLPHTPCRNQSCKSLECCALLQANVMTGGRLLGATGAQRELQKKGVLGCENLLGELTSVGDSGFLWEGLSATLQGVAGRLVDMPKLHWSAPDSVPLAARDTVDLRCTELPATGSKEAVRVCIFNGGHTYPWNGDVTTGNSNDWLPVAGRQGEVFHRFVWEDFLQGGEVARKKPRGELVL